LLDAKLVRDRNLLEQQSTLFTPANQQAMPADLDFVDTYGARSGEQRDFDLKTWQFLGAHRAKAPIVQRCACGAPYDRLTQRVFGLDHANATSQPLANVKRDEHTTSLRENPICRNIGQELVAGYGFGDSQACQSQQ
jgi:hypothetical protein